MGFLKGSTDITNMQADLYSLLTGGMAAGQRGSGQAGNGVTLNVTDRWDALDGTNRVIRSQRTEKGFAGEYALYRGCPRFAARATGTTMAATPQAFMGKPTFTGNYSGGTVRVYFAAFVSTNNSSPGSLTSTVVTWTLVNADTGTTITSGTATGWTGSSDTKLLAQGVSLTLTLQAGETFVAGTNAVMWLRAYTTTFTQGMDYWPEAANLKSGTLVVANTSGGANAYTSGVDYDLVQQAHDFPKQSTTIGTFDLQRDWGSTGVGCGICWDTSGAPPSAGANYFIVDADYYVAYLHIPLLTPSGGNQLLFGGPMQYWDATLSKGRGVIDASVGRVDLNTSTLSMGQVFTGAAQAGSTFINFWITCTQDKIIIVMRGDTGQGGRTVVLSFQRYNPLVATDDWPWIWIPDGSANRPSAYLQPLKLYYDIPYWGSPSTTVTPGFPWYPAPSISAGNFNTLFTGLSNSSLTAGGAGKVPDQNPNPWQLRWWLYTIYLHANRGGSNLAGTFDISKEMGIRGKLRGIFGVALDNFSNLDELIDASSTYLLVTPNTDWNNSLGSEYEAVAILEE